MAAEVFSSAALSAYAFWMKSPDAVNTARMIELAVNTLDMMMQMLWGFRLVSAFVSRFFSDERKGTFKIKPHWFSWFLNIVWILSRVSGLLEMKECKEAGRLLFSFQMMAPIECGYYAKIVIFFITYCVKDSETLKLWAIALICTIFTLASLWECTSVSAIVTP